MEAAAHEHHDHEDHHGPLPTSGGALNSVAFSATLHCLTGCALGEIAGMVIGTALGFSDWGTVGLAVALAFLFGYTLTSLPLLKAGFALSAVIPIALATDTFSIATMEVVDNAIMLAVPGAMEAGVGDVLFWGALSFALVVAGVVAYPVNRWLITKNKGHAVLHETGIHGGPPTNVVAAIAAVAAVFGATVLVVDTINADGEGHGAGGGHAERAAEPASGGGHGGHAGGAPAGGGEVRGLAVSEDGLKLEMYSTEVPRGERTQLRFRILDSGGAPVRDFQVEHAKRMHLIVARRDLTGFQHLHPRMSGDGTWSTPVTVPAAGSYRVFADFKRGNESHTLASDLAVDGPVDWQELPEAAKTASAGDGYEVELSGASARAGSEAELSFTVTRDGRPVHVQPYLGARGHLVALRQGDLAYLHVHPTEHGDEHSGGHDDAIGFATEFPSDGAYRLFLQFKHEDQVRTAAFTTSVDR